MTDDDGKPLFDAVRDALSHQPPVFGQGAVRQRVLEAYSRGRPPHRSWTVLRLALAGIVLSAAVVLGFSLRAPVATTFRAAGRDGQVGSALRAEGSQGLPLSFSEGSRVALGPGSVGRVGRLTAQGARIELERGSLSAQVVHRPNTDWTFVGGPFEVAVLGTQLDVSWAPEAQRFEVRVVHGLVRVRGPLLPTGQQVGSGQTCAIDLKRGLVELGLAQAAASPVSATPRADSAEPALPLAPSASTPSAPVSAALTPDGESVRPAWLSLIQAGKYREAIAGAERAGMPNVYRSASAEALLELARAARLSGHSDIERAALLACRKRASGQPAAAQAAYLLGRASTSAEAANWFATYIREQPRGLLAREAAGRLIESFVAAGNHESAAQAARSYLAAYPEGPHAVMARRVVGADERP